MKTILVKIKKATFLVLAISTTKYKLVPMKYMWIKVLTTLVKLTLLATVAFFIFSLFFGIVIGTMLIGALLGSTEDAAYRQTSIRSRRGPFV